MSEPKRNKQSGFSLIEASVVMVIICMAVATAMSFQDLSRTAKLRNVIVDFQEASWQTDTFSALYKGLPGDLNNASTFWPDMKNGDGNGLIEEERDENHSAWKQLSVTKLLKKDLDSVQRLPKAPLEQESYYNMERNKEAIYTTAENSRNGISLKPKDNVGNTISPVHSKILDNKMDDGKADKGKLVAYAAKNGPNDCTKTSENDGSVKYRIDNKEPGCNLTYWVDIKNMAQE